MEIEILEKRTGQYVVVQIDEEDLHYITEHPCTITSSKHTKYVSVYVNGKTIGLHRLIMNAPSGLFVDHIDGNGLNNKKSNLRLCTVRQNCRNRKHVEESTSKYKGVHYMRKSGRWRARIIVNGRPINLGTFYNESDGGHAYDVAALKYYGEYARLNFPDDVWTQEQVDAKKCPQRATSKYKGVGFDKKRNLWRARVQYSGQDIHVGYFPTEKDAAIARNKKIIDLGLDKSLLNVIDDIEEVE